MGRAVVDKAYQFGKETTAGTQVAANKKLPALSVTLTPQIDKENFRAAGFKNTTVSALSGLWATGSFEGPLDFNAIIWALEGLVGTTPTTPSGGTLSRQWAYTPAASGSDSNAKTFTAECGDPAAARVYTRLRFRSLALEVARRSGSRMNGSVYANFPTDGQTLTASPTSIAQQSVSAIGWDIYMDTTFGGIGGTKLANAYAARFGLADKFNPFFRLNSTDAGAIGDEAEIAHDLTASVSIMHDATSRSLFGTLATNPTRYFRFKATGPIIEGSIAYSIILDFAAQFENPDDDDNDGIFGVTYALRPIYDASLGGNWRITVVNTITAV